MRMICAWCRQPMDDEVMDDNPVSHGICDSCLQNALIDGTLGADEGAGRYRAERALPIARAAASRDRANPAGDVTPARGP